MVKRHSLLWALGLIFVANFLNYTDRQLVSALEVPITTDPALRLTETEYGWLWSYFTIGYMICAVPVGLLADRYRRTYLFAFCITVWSLATVASGMAQTKLTLNLARVFIGVGEAGCLVIGPSLISDYFATGVRGKALSAFYLGLPLGGATAFLLAATLKDHLTWREMFYLAGVPGFLVGLLVLLLPEPPRGSSDEGVDGHHGRHDRHGHGGLGGYVRLLRTPTLLLIILAQAFAVVMLVPLVHFGKRFLETDLSLGDKRAGLVMLGVLVAGMVGNVLSGLIGDWLSRRLTGAYALLAGLGYLAGFTALCAGFLVGSQGAVLAGMIIGSFFLFLCMPAVNTQLANVTSPKQRGAAWALAVFLLHLLGDTSAPPLFGAASSSLGRRLAFVYFSLALIPATLCCLIAVLTAPADTERVARGVEVESGSSRALPQPSSTHDAEMKVPRMGSGPG
jgi:MFS transporter, Spinster family, sphingosine-1-phosphate transporter